MGTKLKMAGVAAVGMMAGALATMQFQAVARGSFAPLPLEEVQRLSQVFDIIKTGYVEPVSEKKLISDAIAGMVQGLDPHSQFFDKKSLSEFRESTTGRFVGIGIEIAMEDGLVKVVSPIEGTPAFRAGLKSGDLITRIDDTPVKGLTSDQAVKRIRGEPATQVRLTIHRKDEARTFPITLTREEIRQQSVRGKIVEPGYGWVRISVFQERTVEDFVRKMEDLVKAEPNMKGLVLDLRNDPGGLLEASIAISAAFLPQDVTVVSTNGQVSDAKAIYRATPNHYARRGQDPLRRLPEAVKKVPLVVLVNEGSASASEIVAGALQDHKRAVIMGSQTFGKGSVQSAICLDGGQYRIENCPTAALKMTTARYYTPLGRSIQATGIVPDVWLDETAEGNVFAELRMREVDLEKHLSGVNEKKDEARDKARNQAREEALRKLEEQRAKSKDAVKPLPEFGSAEDFPLRQALNQLQSKPVVASKSAVERKAEAKIE